ncbi:MAG: methyltransferase domain-containing protein [Candidatus Omnitrophota bacterium]
MPAKILKAIKNPWLIILYLHKHWHYFIVSLRSREIVQIYKNGDMYYKYKGDLYPEYLNKGNASSFIVDKAKQYCIGKGIDIGADAWPLPGAIPILNEEHQNAYKLDNFPDNSLDYVFSSHCLEHLDKWQAALKLWIKKIKQQGILFLYLPHKSMKMWNRGGPWVGYGHKWIPTAEVVNKFLKKNGMEIIEYNPSKDKYWSFHIVAKKTDCEHVKQGHNSL